MSHTPWGRGTHRHIAMTTSTQTKYYWVVQSILVVSIRGESTWVGTIGNAAKDYAFLHIFPVPSSGPDWSFARPILASRAYVWHPIPYNIIDLKNKVKLVGGFFNSVGQDFLLLWQTMSTINHTLNSNTSFIIYDAEEQKPALVPWMFLSIF